MKALVYTAPEHLEYRDVPDPIPTQDELLIQIEAAGICGSDMHAYLGHDDRRPAPLILGHEAAGIICTGERKGERVTINPLVTCGKCEACLANQENLCPNRQILSMMPREGTFAQYALVPERNLISLPDHISFDVAALAEPLSVSWHAVKLGVQALHNRFERKVLVIGGGAIGLAAALALKAQGFVDITITEPNENRRIYLNEKCAVTAVSNTNDTFPLIIDAVGIAQTRAFASAQALPGGVIIHIGLGDNGAGLDIRRITLQEISFIGAYTYTMQDFKECCQAMFEGLLGPLDWAILAPLENGAEIFQDIRQGRIATPKIIFKPNQ